MGLISNGTTIFDNGIVNVGGSMTFISKATASASASIEFTLGDYKEYKFFFVNMHPQTDNVKFEFNGSIDSGSNYNVVKTTTMIDAIHSEGGAYGVVGYGILSLAQSTAFQNLANDQGNASDENVGGYLHLFNPSSTTFVKHFIASTSRTSFNDISAQQHYGGYFNTTSALTNLKFQFSSGNIDAGEILLFGVN